MRPKTRVMSAVDFEAVKPFLANISEDRCNAAKAALVDGLTLKQVGDQYGWTRQAVNDVVTSFWQVYERYQQGQAAASEFISQTRPGWELVTIVAPTDLVNWLKSQNLVTKKSPETPKSEPGTKST